MTHQSCYHCASEIPSGIEISTIIQNEKRFFCCSACQAVAELITGEDFNQYYQLREKSASKPAPAYSPEHWRAYDQIADHYVFQDGETQEIHLYVDGIHCGACSWLIRKALADRLKIDDVRVNVSTARAEIRWNNGVLLSEILILLNELGYRPDLYRPDQSEKRFNQERNQMLFRLIIAGIVSMQVMMFSTGMYFGMDPDSQKYEQYLRWIGLLCTTPVLFYSGWDFLKSAWLGIKFRQLNMDFPITVGLLGSYLASAYHVVIGHGEIYFESVTMFIFFILISRFIEFLTRRRARLNEHRFAKLLPEIVETADGRFIPLATLKVGMEILVRPSSTFPADGVIIRGESRADESMLNGESTPIFKALHDKVLAGSHNLESPVWIKVESTGQNTTLASIQRLMARAQQHRAPQLNRQERLAQQTVIWVVILAGLGYLFWQFIAPERAFEIAVAVLVATCPCALSLATPTALTRALNQANEAQILIKDSATLERLLNIETIIVDKTGTLTQGQFQLIDAQFQMDETQAWQIIKSLERYSHHPLAWFFTQQPVEALTVENMRQMTGLGVEGQINGQWWRVGSASWVTQCGLMAPKPEALGTTVYLFDKRACWAYFVLNDPLRPNISETIQRLKDYHWVMASGDKEKAVEALANQLNIQDFYAECSPEDKLNLLAKYSPERTLMLGDGNNDAPILAGAGVSVAVLQASALSQTQADIVLLQNSVEALPQLFNLARTTQKIIRQNLIWATLYNVIIVPLAIAGYLTPWLAGLGMSMSSLLVVLNALRVKF